MDGPATISEVLSLLGSGMTPHDLAESMSNPLWYLSRLPIETDIAIAITSLRHLRNRVHKELQHSLIDEFIDPPDPSDTDRKEFVVEQMRQLIPREANADILSKVIYAYVYGEEERIVGPTDEVAAGAPTKEVVQPVDSKEDDASERREELTSGAARVMIDDADVAMDEDHELTAEQHDAPKNPRRRRI
jgi:hypothetical protein